MKSAAKNALFSLLFSSILLLSLFALRVLRLETALLGKGEPWLLALFFFAAARLFFSRKRPFSLLWDGLALLGPCLLFLLFTPPLFYFLYQKGVLTLQGNTTMLLSPFKHYPYVAADFAQSTALSALFFFLCLILVSALFPLSRKCSDPSHQKKGRRVLLFSALLLAAALLISFGFALKAALTPSGNMDLDKFIGLGAFMVLLYALFFLLCLLYLYFLLRRFLFADPAKGTDSATCLAFLLFSILLLFASNAMPTVCESAGRISERNAILRESLAPLFSFVLLGIPLLLLFSSKRKKQNPEDETDPPKPLP